MEGLRARKFGNKELLEPQEAVQHKERLIS